MPVNPQRNSTLFYVVGAAIFAASIYLSFELGRYEAGYSIFDERRDVRALQEIIDERDDRIEELLRQQAILETSGEIDRETYAAVEAELAALQLRIQSQEEELAFYRGIVSPGDGVAGLRIQNVEVAADAVGDGYLLRVLLVQAIVHNQRVTGTVRVRLSGEQNDEAVVYTLDELVADAEIHEIPYGFRYFQSLEQGLALPEGFEPGELQIEIWPREPRGETVSQSFSWAAIAG